MFVELCCFRKNVKPGAQTGSVPGAFIVRKLAHSVFKGRLQLLRIAFVLMEQRFITDEPCWRFLSRFLRKISIRSPSWKCRKQVATFGSEARIAILAAYPGKAS